MTEIAITGYASLDYSFRLDRPPAPDQTATILSRPPDWPRLGGSPAYIASALVAGGVADAAPISWVGDDADGALYRDALARRGASVEGVVICPGRTPVCVLAYQPDGGCHCFYHPGLSGSPTLDARQIALIVEAPWVCVTVGPTEATRRALDAIAPETRLVWAVKADPRAVPPDLAARLAARADIIAMSRAEADFVEAALAAGPPRKRQTRLETRGVDGVALTGEGRDWLYPVKPVAAEDVTGAGDTFLGGFLAAMIRGDGRPDAALAAGADAARDMLLARELAAKGDLQG
jgi:ribokinase